MDLIKQALNVAKDTRQTRWICPLLLAGDAVLSIAVVLKIAYTEIDWIAYMQQISQYVDGERDYIKLYGDTGPLVYPAMHVYIYRFLYAITNQGQDIKLAQYIFIGLYLATLWLVMQCYRAAKVPPYVFPLLILSKRLHSVFLLRLFNDCFAVFFLFLAIYCYQRRLWSVGSLAYSIGLGVKMSLLLALPGIGVVLWQAIGRDRALRQAMFIGQFQILIGFPFLLKNPWGYLSRAFEFSRQFLFKWTVNWRFVGEERFLSKHFAFVLLAGHMTVLGIFICTRWLRMTPEEAVRYLISPPPLQEQAKLARKTTPSFILATILTAVMIGCQFARSLHYQFYAYIAWSMPFLLWRSGLHPVLVYLVWAAQEWAWNVYPSTDTSSLVVVVCIKATVLSIWFGTEVPEDARIAGQDKTEHVD
ncbi:dolichyl-P-Man:Man(5)GlcNAc(2)-PP-dolichol alpha-1,3-mannosyltransferase [Saxophila tyrrhenica]|uniref:Dol-P-Man:Man(5)GlcNAc(2)-PP-Dol alpha-1,3-mannosyltransferase n=1 Tax=Saxophila tyrrhenica TaxID=1690608 RepID=A0AAV9NYC6_9PEZI|nr:dolichyl-P-Man:Man(5)GlcNAc(2)-PP-dolichol alpha-1,3-mannosyltransferase [Saxophila tyrrhenica]